MIIGYIKRVLIDREKCNWHTRPTVADEGESVKKRGRMKERTGSERGATGRQSRVVMMEGERREQKRLNTFLGRCASVQPKSTQSKKIASPVTVTR